VEERNHDATAFHNRCSEHGLQIALVASNLSDRRNSDATDLWCLAGRCQVIRVFTWNRDDLRAMAYFEFISGSTLEREPTSLFLSEFNSFVLDAISNRKECCMKTLNNVPVTSKKQVVDLIAIDIPETFDEARQYWGEDMMLELATTQWKIKHLNRARAAATGGPTETEVEALAWDLVSSDEFSQIQGDRVRRAKILEEKKAIVRKDYAARRAQRLAYIQSKAAALQNGGEADEE